MSQFFLARNVESNHQCFVRPKLEVNSDGSLFISWQYERINYDGKSVDIFPETNIVEYGLRIIQPQFYAYQIGQIEIVSWKSINGMTYGYDKDGNIKITLHEEAVKKQNFKKEKK